MTGTCSVEGCEKPVKTRGWCGAHYERWRRNGEPGRAGDARKRLVPRGPCAIDGCDDIEAHHGWCAKHYERARRHGDPNVMLRPTYGSKRVTSGSNGYPRLYRPGHPLADSIGYVYEHRFVLYEAGIAVDGRHVHHINGDKTDNRIENLEVLDSVEHATRHIAENRFVKNQFGTWPVRKH